jgi:thymidylate kinase
MGHSDSGTNIAERFLIEVFESLDRAGIEYCVLRNYDTLPRSIKNDVDILVKEQNLERAGRVVIGCCGAVGMRLFHRVRHADLALYFCPVNDIKPQVHIDIFHEAAWKAFRFLEPDAVLHRRKKYKCFYIPHPHDEALISFFTRLLYKGSLKEAYCQAMVQALRSSNSSVSFRLTLHRILGSDIANFMAASILQQKWAEICKSVPRIRLRLIKANILRHPLRSAISLLKLVVRYADRVLHPPGISVVAIGPDGSGKSTLLKGLQETMGTTFANRQIRVHWQPPFWHNGKASQHDTVATVLDPYQNAPRTTILSLIYFSYHWLHFAVSSWSFIFVQRLRGFAIWFDRYYVDLFADAERYRLNLPPWVVKLGYLFVHKPNVMFYLDAPAEMLCRRKPSASSERLENLRRRYAAFVRKEPNVIVIDSKQDYQHSVALACACIIKHLQSRLRIPHNP